MRKWDYKIIRIKPPKGKSDSEIDNSTVNELGEEGWELVSVLSDIVAGYSLIATAFFKRERGK